MGSKLDAMRRAAGHPPIAVPSVTVAEKKIPKAAKLAKPSAPLKTTIPTDIWTITIDQSKTPMSGSLTWTGKPRDLSASIGKKFAAMCRDKNGQRIDCEAILVSIDKIDGKMILGAEMSGRPTFLKPVISPRLPHGAKFTATYTAVSDVDGYWDATLIVGGEPFTTRKGGVFTAMKTLDRMYREWAVSRCTGASCPAFPDE